MYAQIEKAKEKRSQSGANAVFQKRSGTKSAFSFVDSRPEAVAQGKLQGMANDSLRAGQLKTFQNMVNNSPIQRLAKNNVIQLALYDTGYSAPMGVVQRAGPPNQMWDDYFDAYENLMSVKRNSNHVIDPTWRNYFYHLEDLLYQAKDHGNPTQYHDPNVQDAHSQLMTLGVVPPAPAPDPNQTAAQALVVAANARWAVFRGNPLVDRGAWAGSNNHGPRPGDYVQTGAGPINVIRHQGIALGAWWIMQSDTAPSGWALHRGGVDARGDFIYHL